MLGQVVVASHGYAYDAAGNRTRKTTADFAEDYRYDLLDRLTGVDRSGPSATLARFGYDPAGNRVEDAGRGRGQVDGEIARGAVAHTEL